MRIVRRGLALSLLMLVIGGLSCAGSDGGTAGRLVAVHNALESVGFDQVGDFNEGYLREGESEQETYELQGGECYVFVAFGDVGVRNIDLALTSPEGEQIATDEVTDRQAVLRVCAESDGEYTLRVTMSRGQGSYLLAEWTGGELGGLGSTGPANEPEGSCGNPFSLAMGQTVSGSTTNATDLSEGRCVSGAAPDVAYELSLDQRATVCFSMTSTYDGALILQQECGSAASEIACNDDAPDTRHSRIQATLDPGTYYLLASGFGNGRGNYSITAEMAETRSVDEVCQQAETLTPGQRVQGTTAGCLPDQFQATCAAGARSAEQVYRLNLQSRARVRIEAATTSHDGSLYLRRTCNDPASELACNDDYRDVRHSVITSTLDPGTYYVFVDGYGEGAQGPFTLEAQVAPVGGNPVPGDACSSAQPIQAGRIHGSTLRANADLTGSCANDQGGPDLVYRLSLRERSRVRATLGGGAQNMALYIQRSCGQQSSEVACSASSLRQRRPEIDQVLQRGTYYLVVDGTDQNAFGDFDLDLDIRSTAAMERQCRRAPLLRSGRAMTGQTSGADEFQASCAGGARSPENIYRIVLRRRRRVRITVEGNYDQALYLRRDCLDQSTEVACNDDHGDNRHSLIETTLDPGTYYLFVDGYASGSSGQYTVRMELENP